MPIGNPLPRAHPDPFNPDPLRATTPSDPMNSSFLPEDYLARKLARRSNIVCISLCAVVLCFICFAFFVKVQQKNVAVDKNQQADAEVEAKARQIDQIAQLEKQTDEQKKKAAITSQLLDPVKKSNLLAELINTMPVDLSLTDMDLKTETPKNHRAPSTSMSRRRADAAPPANTVVKQDVNLEIVGLAATDVLVSEYIGALQTHPLFATATLVTTGEKKIDDVVLRQFKLKVQVDPHLTMADLTPTRKKRGMGGSSLDEPMLLTPDAAQSVSAADLPLD